MDFLIWNATPVYKGNQPQPAQSTGLLAGLGRMLGGGGAPTYKTLNRASVQAPAPSASWWPVSSAAPVYKTATAGAGATDGSSPDDSSPDDGDGESDPTCVCDDQATVVVIE